ncbi:hypothetical protein A3A79_05650 [Candidatus Gottesmanbacteria bacterium RIFCSPLOWO2_01_FULL_43_11b]|uniref:Uncharacterized protein n=1 Tax=Candidatus Gottesmanbacteria bacterium RIFCSPLOWO2_01_FULL_43_11b TaxID=1798392 RepID=A0A1F6AJL7_9BACT|nr:MAG: hypothetical protein A3A79_05650 [Candidatus Gottesmanbacteria bacterium RIFCSPLOWO2_01_FULL_43_11b]
MITDNDVKKLKKVFVTKQELKDELRYQKEEIIAKMDGRFAKLGKAIEEKIEKMKDDIIKQVGKFIAQAVLPITDDHETRIKKIEKHVFPTQ